MLLNYMMLKSHNSHSLLLDRTMKFAKIIRIGLFELLFVFEEQEIELKSLVRTRIVYLAYCCLMTLTGK